jgi:hypothetical protein
MRLNDLQRNLPYNNQLYTKDRLGFFAPDSFVASASALARMPEGLWGR